MRAVIPAYPGPTKYYYIESWQKNYQNVWTGGWGVQPELVRVVLYDACCVFLPDYLYILNTMVVVQHALLCVCVSLSLYIYIMHKRK